MPTTSARTIRVVLADDDVVVRTTLRRVLERSADLELVGEAGDGDSALALITAHDPDVVVLDVHMPGRTGLEVARAIRTSGNTTPILFLTADPNAQANARDIERCLVVLKSSTSLRDTLDLLRLAARRATPD